MGPLTIGTIVSYQGRCWLVTRVAGGMLHLVTQTSPGHTAAMDVPRSYVSQDLRSTESARYEMYCSFKNQVQTLARR